MYPSAHFRFFLSHYQDYDGPGLETHALAMARTAWDQLTAADLSGIQTRTELIERVEERYNLSREQATRDVEFWALDKQL